MVHLLAYVIAVVAAAVVAPIIGAVLFLVTYPMLRPFRPLGRCSLLYNFATSAASMSLAMVLFIWSTRQLDVTPAFLMFLVPWIGVTINGYHRIDAAKEGRFLSRAGQHIAGHINGIDSRGCVWGEYGFISGDMIGMWLPVVIIVGDMPFW